MTEQKIVGPQCALNVSASPGGHGIPILFVHSDAGNLRHWDTVRAHYPDRPTAAFDRRGHGKSGAPHDGSFEKAAASQDIAAIADALEFERFILVGHSGGALNALAFSGLHPERVDGLVLVDPPPDPAALPPGMLDNVLTQLKGDNYDKTVQDYYRSIAGGAPAVVERILADARATPRETVIGTLEAMENFDPKDFVGYDGPALSIIQPQHDVDGALHRIAGFDHTAVGSAGHWIHLAAPDRFLDVLDHFVRKVDHIAALAPRAFRPYVPH
jgi:pimeloyl-ACP methyl ester carboxylesterase